MVRGAGWLTRDKAAQQKNDKKTPKEAAVPAIGTRHDDGKPDAQHTQQHCRAEQKEVEKYNPAGHSSAPPVGKG